jgi:hypothetical protein
MDGTSRHDCRRRIQHTGNQCIGAALHDVGKEMDRMGDEGRHSHVELQGADSEGHKRRKQHLALRASTAHWHMVR